MSLHGANIKVVSMLTKGLTNPVDFTVEIPYKTFHPKNYLQKASLLIKFRDWTDEEGSRGSTQSRIPLQKLVVEEQTADEVRHRHPGFFCESPAGVPYIVMGTGPSNKWS